MDSWIGPTVKQLNAMHVLHNFFGLYKITTAFCLGLSCLHLLLLKSSMSYLLARLAPAIVTGHGITNALCTNTDTSQPHDGLHLTIFQPKLEVAKARFTPIFLDVKIVAT